MMLTDVIPLAGDHNRKSFSCGESSLDNWLLRNARKAVKADTARTYVVCDPAGVVMGYYALCMYSLVPEEVAPCSAGQHAVPAVLLSRLSVSQTTQRTGLVEDLLLDHRGV
mgnify:CR=1 FL=1